MKFMLSSQSIVQQGRYLEVLGSETKLYPIDNLDRVTKLPAMWLFHGTDVSAYLM